MNRIIHYDQQDNEEDEPQEDSQPLKKLHTEASQEKSLVEIPNKNSQGETENIAVKNIP